MAGGAKRAPAHLLARIVAAWALAGGGLILGLVALNVWSVLSDALFSRPFPGTFELTELGVAVAVFAFLPYCQLSGGNVTVEIFTARASRRQIAGLRALGALAALGFSLLLAWRMGLGLADQRAANFTTTILQIPVWLAYLPTVASLLLLAASAGATLASAASAARAP